MAIVLPESECDASAPCLGRAAATTGAGVSESSAPDQSTTLPSE